MEETKEEFFICTCYNKEHLLSVNYDKEINTIFLEVRLQHVYPGLRGFWYRLKYGIKYILGYKGSFGAFHEFQFNYKDKERLITVLNHLK
jgi:hypothetical protein